MIPRLRTLILTSLAAVACALHVGCPATNDLTAKKALPPAKAQPLVLFVADDPQLGQAIAREWLGRTEEALTVRDVSLAELGSANRLAADVVVFPSGLIGQLAERGLIMPLEPAALEDPEFNH